MVPWRVSPQDEHPLPVVRNRLPGGSVEDSRSGNPGNLRGVRHRAGHHEDCGCHGRDARDGPCGGGDCGARRTQDHQTVRAAARIAGFPSRGARSSTGARTARGIRAATSPSSSAGRTTAATAASKTGAATAPAPAPGAGGSPATTHRSGLSTVTEPHGSAGGGCAAPSSTGSTETGRPVCRARRKTTQPVPGARSSAEGPSAGPGTRLGHDRVPA